MRFEKVSYSAFADDVRKWYRPIKPEELFDRWNGIRLPERKTKYSCGYDLETPLDIVLAPHTSIVIPTGIRVVFSEEERETWHLKLYARSSVGIKDQVVITNGTGLVDSDFSDSENEGDMLIALTNMSDEVRKYKAGNRVCQAVFEIYGITSDDKASGQRKSGVGSTGK